MDNRHATLPKTQIYMVRLGFGIRWSRWQTSEPQEEVIKGGKPLTSPQHR
jgi:hypothetical protein